MGLKDDDKGISLVFANTYKGKKLFEDIKSKLESIEISFEKASVSQEAMIKSVPYNQNRELFFAQASEKGLEKIIRGWFGYDLPTIIKRHIGYRKYCLANTVRKR